MTDKLERCPARSPGGVTENGTLPKGKQCGLPKGHDGDHTLLIPSDVPWAKTRAEKEMSVPSEKVAHDSIMAMAQEIERLCAENAELRAECLRLNHAEAEAMALVLRLEEQVGKLCIENAALQSSSLSEEAFDILESENRSLHAENADLRALIASFVADPHGCRFCDYGKLRSMSRSHDETCPYARAAAIAAARGAQKTGG